MSSARATTSAMLDGLDSSAKAMLVVVEDHSAADTAAAPAPTEARAAARRAAVVGAEPMVDNARREARKTARVDALTRLTATRIIVQVKQETTVAW